MKIQTLSAAYLQSFTCTGSQCEDTCCFGWGVNIDKRTFAKYKLIKDKKWKGRLARHIKRSKYETTYSAYAVMKMDEGGYCPFLNQQKLCSIQLELGTSYLSKTCAGYPRLLNRVMDRFEWSGSLSCPEIARLALLNPDGIRFMEVESEIEPNPLLDKLFDDEEWDVIFAELRPVMIGMVRDRTMPLTNRLLLLGALLEQVESHMQAGDVASAKRVIHGSDTFAHRHRELVERLPIDAGFQLQLLQTIIDDYDAVNAITSKRYLQCLQQFRDGLGTEAPVERYQEAYRRHMLPFLEEHGYILENYLVNNIFSRLFPFAMMGESVMGDYVVLVLHYALVQMHLTGMAAYHQGLTADQALVLIQSFARTFEHDVSFFSHSLQRLREIELDHLPGMSLLLRHS